MRVALPRTSRLCSAAPCDDENAPSGLRRAQRTKTALNAF
jgi:hypothetical protein